MPTLFISTARRRCVSTTGFLGESCKPISGIGLVGWKGLKIEGFEGLGIESGGSINPDPGNGNPQSPGYPRSMSPVQVRQGSGNG